MTIIRGATTIERDTKEEISLAVKTLLDEVFTVNCLQKKDVKGFVFSLTSDIHSYHPAKAARECGYDFAPLFATLEPDIQGGLKRCIRLLLLTEVEYSVKHKRIVVKIGTSTLTYATGKLNIRRIETLVRVLSDMRNAGLEVVLVSSGAVSAGTSRLGLEITKRTVEEKQALAAVGGV